MFDSQRTKIIAASEEGDFDGGEKVNGRKRHITVDTLGCMLLVVVHAANIHDTNGSMEVASRAFDEYPMIGKLCGDDGYRDTFVDYIALEFQIDVDILSRIKPVFEILPKRWIVERTLAWLSNSGCLLKDYEISISSQEAFIMIFHARVLLQRLVAQ